MKIRKIEGRRVRYMQHMEDVMKVLEGKRIMGLLIMLNEMSELKIGEKGLIKRKE